jgi:hypothetical protein
MAFPKVLEVFLFVCVVLCILYHNNAPGNFPLIKKKKTETKQCFKKTASEIGSARPPQQ